MKNGYLDTAYRFSKYIHKMSYQAENAGKPWTIDLDTQLVEYVRNGKNVKEIADEMKRTFGSIRARIVGLACNMVTIDSKPIEEVASFFKIGVYDIQNELDRRQYRNNQRRNIDEANKQLQNFHFAKEFLEMKSLLIEIRNLLRHS